MRNVTVTVTMFLLSFLATSQETINNEKRSKESNSTPTNVVEVKPTSKTKTQKNGTTISKRAGEEQRTHDAAYYAEEIDKVNKRIQAINTKVEHVRNDEEENAKALESGWYDQMKAHLSHLEHQKVQLQKKLEQFQ